MKTPELTRAALDWAVHVALHGSCEGHAEHEYSTDWSQGGPIIEREGIGVGPAGCARKWNPVTEQYDQFTGPTPLIAAMRCYVASKLGDDINIPEELL
jgi:hypothetical protein